MASARAKKPQPGQLTIAGMNGAVAGTDRAAPNPSRAFADLLSEGRQRRSESEESARPQPPRPAGPPDGAAARSAAEPTATAGWKPDLAFCAREFVLVTLPHSDPGDVDIFSRRNGNLTLTIQSGYDPKRGRKVGIPYGTVPRLFMYYANTQVVTNANAYDRRISLGNSLTDFFRELGFEAESRGRTCWCRPVRCCGGTPRTRNRPGRAKAGSN